MNTADQLDELGEKQDAETAYREVMRHLDVIGFNPHTDAINQQDCSPVIFYFHEKEIRYTKKGLLGKDIWFSPKPLTPGRLYERLTSASNYCVIDKKVFNWLASGPLADLDGVHNGLCWGIERLFKHDIKNGNTPNFEQIKYVDGIGDKLGRQVSQKFREYPTFPESMSSPSP